MVLKKNNEGNMGSEIMERVGWPEMTHKKQWHIIMKITRRQSKFVERAWGRGEAG